MPDLRLAGRFAFCCASRAGRSRAPATCPRPTEAFRELAAEQPTAPEVQAGICHNFERNREVAAVIRHARDASEKLRPISARFLASSSILSSSSTPRREHLLVNGLVHPFGDQLFLDIVRVFEADVLDVMAKADLLPCRAGNERDHFRFILAYRVSVRGALPRASPSEIFTAIPAWPSSITLSDLTPIGRRNPVHAA